MEDEKTNEAAVESAPDGANHDKDISQNHLLDVNEIFADLFRTFGEDFDNLQPDELENYPVRHMFLDQHQLHEFENDIVKLWTKNGQPQAILVIENQSQKDLSMPERQAMYKGLIITSSRLEHGPGKCPPIGFLVLPFGTKSAWTDPGCLYDQWKSQPKSRIISGNEQPVVIDIGSLSQERIERLDSEDLKAVFEVVKWKRKKTIEWPIKPRTLQYPQLTALAIAAICGQMQYAESILERIQKHDKEDITLEDIFYFTTEAERQAEREKARNKLNADYEKVFRYAMSRNNPWLIEDFIRSKMDADAFIQSMSCQ